jgi:hypothetical protein
MPGVEGLTHDHLVEISAGVYMKFKHAYAVGQVSDQAVELLDPHGEVTVDGEKEQLYSPDLKVLVQNLFMELNIFKKELEASEYKEFSLSIKDRIDTSITALRKKGKRISQSTIPIVEAIRKNWVRISSPDKLIEKDGRLTGLRIKTARNIMGVLSEKKEALEKEDVGRGFGIFKQGDKISGEQKVNYNNLIRSFESIKINRFV